ncbi:hypothetical protein ANCDUO_14933 [Ancylostoma duodenale]|uniref:Abnormal cell migration protein 18-like fibronectin type I domain-containing protein n=1 Tax=Ancylostoma duodenale TaxID=51022 RepID=A0A0C2CF16_9BILA|nr:hypothetical protein ANCDUO_14933 [Ancylostoma duodenale]
MLSLRLCRWVSFYQWFFTLYNSGQLVYWSGCVPTNQDDGDVMKVGDTFADTDFVFTCAQSEEGVMSYEAIACVDAHGKRMQLGEMRKLSNGTVILHCNIYGGAVKKVVERAAGCYFNETIYGEDELWVEPLRNGKPDKTFKKKVKFTKVKFDENGSQLSGRLMQCFRPHFSYYESQVIGCAVGRVGVRFDDIIELSGKHFRCVQEDEGILKLNPVGIDEMSCKMDNQTYSHLANWTDTSRAAQMSCMYGHLKKTGCLVAERSIPIGQEVQISNGCVFLCHPQTNVYICDRKLGNWTIEESGGLEKPAAPRKFSL